MRVLRKASSSARTVVLILLNSVSSSGYASTIAFFEVRKSFPNTGSLTPRRRIARTVLLRRRRRTYPRPSLPGETPSPISIKALLTWSATTRSLISSSSFAP